MPYLLASLNSCNDVGLARTLMSFKNMLTLIQIIAPILLIIMASFHLVKLMTNPEDKKKLQRVKNSFIAAAVIFFIPLLLNVVMNLLGSSTTISDCWNNPSSSGTNPTYMDPYETGKKSTIYTNPEDYK